MRCRAALTTLATALALALAPTAARADTTGPQGGERTLGVQGLGEVELTPDVAAFDATVQRISGSSASARTLVAGRLTAILDGLTGVGVPRTDITTTAIQLTKSRTRSPRSHKVRTRWTALGAFAVRVEGGSELTGKALDIAADNGATDLQGPSFTFSTARQTVGRQQAEAAALTDARTRADAAAASQGMRVTGVRSIELDPGTESSTESNAQADSGAATAPAPAKTTAPAPILPGRQTFSSAVRVLYVIEPAS